MVGTTFEIGGFTWYWSRVKTLDTCEELQYIPRNMHTVFALLCFVVVIHWLIFPYPSGLLHWHCGNLTIAPVPAKQPWWIWINTSCKYIMNDCITTTKQSTTKPCAYFLGYTVSVKQSMMLPSAPLTFVGATGGIQDNFCRHVWIDEHRGKQWIIRATESHCNT